MRDDQMDALRAAYFASLNRERLSADQIDKAKRKRKAAKLARRANR